MESTSVCVEPDPVEVEPEPEGDDDLRTRVFDRGTPAPAAARPPAPKEEDLLTRAFESTRPELPSRLEDDELPTRSFDNTRPEVSLGPEVDELPTRAFESTKPSGPTRPAGNAMPARAFAATPPPSVPRPPSLPRPPSAPTASRPRRAAQDLRTRLVQNAPPSWQSGRVYDSGPPALQSGLEIDVQKTPRMYKPPVDIPTTRTRRDLKKARLWANLKGSFGSASRKLTVAIVVGSALVGAVVAPLMLPRPARLTVIARDGMGEQRAAAVFIDGSKRCDLTPCILELPGGEHRVTASMSGADPLQQAMAMRSGDELTLSFAFPALSEAPVRASAELPARPSSVLVRFDVRTPGAALGVRSGDEYRPVPTSLSVAPTAAAITLERDRAWTLEASKPGFETLQNPLILGDGPEAHFVVDLRPVAASPSPLPLPSPLPPSPPPLPVRVPVERIAMASLPATAKPATPAHAASGHPCRIRLNSIPVASVMLDGTKLGDTPRIDVLTAPGDHRAVFSSGMQEKALSFHCGDDEEKALAVRIP
jgi:hypothetical protein